MHQMQLYYQQTSNTPGLKITSSTKKLAKMLKLPKKEEGKTEKGTGERDTKGKKCRKGSEDQEGKKERTEEGSNGAVYWGR